MTVTPTPESARGGRLRRWYDTSLASHHDFRQLWIGDTISQFGTQVGGIALPVLAVTVLGADELQMGLLAMFENLAFLLVGLPAGAWVDRMLKRRVLIAGDVVRGLALLVLPVAYLLDVLTFPLLLVVATVVGVATVFFDVAYQSYLPALVPSSRISEGNAKLQVSHSVAHVAGPGAGGLLIRMMGAPLVILIDALSFLGSVVYTVRIRHREKTPSRDARRPLHVEVGEGLSFVLHQPLLRRIAATTSMSNLFHAIGGSLFVLYVLRDLGLDAAGLGLVLGVGAFGGLAGALSAERLMRLVGEGRLIALSMVASVPAAALLPLAAGMSVPVAGALLALSQLVFGFVVVLYNVTQVSFRQRLCPVPLLGRVNASVRFLVWGVMPIGALVGGVLGAGYGIVTALWVSAAGQALALLPVLLSPLRRMRDLPSELDQHAERHPLP